MAVGSKRSGKSGFNTRRMALALMAVLGIAILLLLTVIYRQRMNSGDPGLYNALIGIGNGDDLEYISENQPRDKGKDDKGNGRDADGSHDGTANNNSGKTFDDLPARYELDVSCIMQLPELPGGCEPVSLTIVLNYMGFNVDKYTIVDDYLPKGAIGETDPSEAFVGDPYDRSGAYGCYAPVIVNTANRYFEDNEYGYVAVDLSGLDLETIAAEYVYKYGRPAIVWASRYMEEIYSNIKWTVNGRDIYWRHNNHCMALTGWDNDSYTVADPLSGLTAYPKELFESRYEQNLENAVFILTQREYAALE